ncbi:hypothetical protein NH26_11550 [Flammeovirga pacifica]|uniref:Secretion system C-terminal sorting domain-containing protein n=1 Tax=Flammeovirga pacifica TaxID=915059 RepID=A0A1S1Z0Y2_FLAPC|nr:hypothetical protein NH26_11550 [Flammeovirga pacifica]
MSTVCAYGWQDATINDFNKTYNEEDDIFLKLNRDIEVGNSGVLDMTNTTIYVDLNGYDIIFREINLSSSNLYIVNKNQDRGEVILGKEGFFNGYDASVNLEEGSHFFTFDNVYLKSALYKNTTFNYKEGSETINAIISYNDVQISNLDRFNNLNGDKNMNNFFLIKGSIINPSILGPPSVPGIEEDQELEKICETFPIYCEILEDDDLPVKLISFNAKKQRNNVLLTWSTASELNASHFTVQKSTDRSRWEDIGEVDAHGNSNTKIDYSFTDNYLGQSSYYRLHQVDFDGASEYFGPLYVNMGNEEQFKVIIMPNPVQVGAPLKVSISGVNPANELSYKVYSSNGQLVFFNKIELNGTSQILEELNYSNHLNKGLYHIIFQNGAQIAKEKLILK